LPKKDKNLIDQRYKEAKRYAKENKKIWYRKKLW
jgi:hypothetical protein